MSESSEPPLALAVEAAGAQHTEALVGLFARTQTACHCQYWHFSGDKNAWLDRLFHAPSENRAAFEVDMAERAGELKGIVALREGVAVGWLKLVEAERVPKLYEQRLYKNLPCFNGPRPREGVLTIGCMLVDEELRRRGVARALVRATLQVATERGARAVEAFPRRSEHAGPAELWTGPPAVYLDAGFRIVSDFAPYPVLRYEIPASV